MVYKFAVVFSIIFIFIIVKLVKKDKLDEKYSILWLFFGLVIFIVSLFPIIITKVSNFFNVYYPPSLLFLLGIIVLGTYIIHISVVITKQNKMIVKLNQELAILKEKQNEKQDEKQDNKQKNKQDNKQDNKQEKREDKKQEEKK